MNGARFQNAVLRSADLSGTQLVQADFTGADLTEASLKDSNVESAVFRNVQGLTDDERNRLEGQAQRWKFELKTGVAFLLKSLYLPAYALVVLVLIGLSFPALRQPDRPGVVAIAAVVNLLTFLPACVLLSMSVLGASTTVQFNAGSSAAMELWSAWVRLWPLFMLTLLFCLVVAVGNGLFFVASCWRWTVFKRAKLAFVYIALTVVHCLFATHWVWNNYPRA